MALAASALLALISAQTTTNDMVTGASSPTSLALATPQSAATVPSAVGTISTATGVRESRIHLVTAGVGGFQFEPAELTNVSVGDVVTFEFYPPDHSVARAEYDSACVPYEYTGKGKTGFWSETQWVETASDVCDCLRLQHETCRLIVPATNHFCLAVELPQKFIFKLNPG